MSRLILVAALAVAVLACSTPVAQAASGFPVTVTAANGKVVVKQRPTRIVSLSASATETLFAVGAGRQVIAVDDQSNFPAGAPQTKLSGYRPNAEAVARYRPDLVITSSASNKLLPALRKLRIAVLLEPSATTHRRRVRARCGRSARRRVIRSRARRLIARTQRGIAAAVASVPKARGLSVFHELSPDYYSATSKTFIGRIYALFGFRNIADNAGGAGDYPQLSGEYILAADPDVVVLADTICCKQTAATGARAAGLAGDLGGQAQPGDRGQRRHRVALGPAHRRLRADRGAGRRARHVTRRRCIVSTVAAVGFVLAAVAAGMLVGAVPLEPLSVLGATARPAAADRRRRRAGRDRADDPVRAAAAARRPRARRGLDAGARRRRLPGRVPQPARRPVPARDRGRRRPRRDDRHRLRPAGGRRRACCCRRRRSSARRRACS